MTKKINLNKTHCRDSQAHIRLTVHNKGTTEDVWDCSGPQQSLSVPGEHLIHHMKEARDQYYKIALFKI